MRVGGVGPRRKPIQARMVRRTDRPLLPVRVSFEATRFGQQHLIEAYAGLTPTLRRTVCLTKADAPKSTSPEIVKKFGGNRVMIAGRTADHARVSSEAQAGENTIASQLASLRERVAAD